MYIYAYAFGQEVLLNVISSLVTINNHVRLPLVSQHSVTSDNAIVYISMVVLAIEFWL